MSYRFTTPVVILMYGLPGAGKSAFARQFAEAAHIAHVHTDRIRFELYDDANFSASENQTVLRLATYMAEELLKTKQSLIFDMHLPTQRLRDDLRKTAADLGGRTLLIWVQTDKETAYYRATHRDRRRADDRFSFNLSQAQFEQLSGGVSGSFKPSEHPIVISGKHLFDLQVKAVWRRLDQLGLLADKPAPLANRGRVDYERRTLSRTAGI